MVQIIPAILSTKEEDFKRDVLRYRESESFKESWVHMDFMDNILVPNLSIDPQLIAKYPLNLHKEAHLMVAYPLKWIDKLVKVGFERIIFHIESEDDPNEVIDYIKSKGIEVGLAIKMDTPIEKLVPFVDKISIVVVMSIVPGFQGQPFIPQVLERIREIKSKGWPIKIGVDGSIKDQNAKVLVEAGVDNLIVGSFLLKGDIDENLEKLWEACLPAGR